MNFQIKHNWFIDDTIIVNYCEVNNLNEETFIRYMREILKKALTNFVENINVNWLLKTTHHKVILDDED